ncbi:MAG TPA: hypothetical protein VF511_10290 [Chthoniobacterales bacterium]
MVLQLLGRNFDSDSNGSRREVGSQIDRPDRVIWEVARRYAEGDSGKGPGELSRMSLGNVGDAIYGDGAANFIGRGGESGAGY